MTMFCCTIATVRAVELNESNNGHDFIRINEACRQYTRGSKITDDTWVEVTMIQRSKLYKAILGIKN